MRSALDNAKINYSVYKGGTAVALKYLYMGRSAAETSVSNRRLSRAWTESSQSPDAAPSNLGPAPWFIAVASTADLTGQIEVVAWGKAIIG
ncbi:conserved hypothetical protein [Mesorhizobium plurifarium]|uniref:Uncharacterized protein n=1 Tax=Mesorhizobium plurifarium TaxID=69974 RepID=A0A090E1E5_MESPL|nr:conserved hypothetical protein [Mesorhizobium plurifarium]